MRFAKLADYRRRLRTRLVDWPIKLKRFEFADLPSVGSGEIVFSSPIVVFAGPNGVGKTTLLRALWAAAAPDEAVLGESTSLKLRAGDAALDFSLPDGGGTTTSAVSFTDRVNGTRCLTAEVLHIDAAAQAKRDQSTFCQVENVDDIINGVGVRSLDAVALTEINYISRRDYREINCYEVESGGEIVPFFEVALGNDRYDSRTMGSGEIALLHLWWAVDRSAPSSLLLIEEPETYLSPASQSSVADFLLVEAVEKQLNVVLTSHSSHMINGFGDDGFVILYRDGSGVKIFDSAPPTALLETIGVSIPVTGVVLVEDAAAVEFLKQILAQHRPGLTRRVEVIQRSGDGGIVTGLRAFQPSPRCMQIIGVFDGDMKGKVPSDLTDCAAFLPGDEAVEKMLRKVVLSAPADLADALGRRDVQAILSTLQGLDHHDWYEKLCAELGVSKAQLFPVMFRIWHAVEGNADAAQQLGDQVATFLGFD